MYALDQTRLQNALSTQNWDEAWETIIDTLDTVKKESHDIMKDYFTEDKQNLVKTFAAIIGKAVITMATNTMVPMSDRAYFGIMWYHETLHDLLWIAGMKETDVLIKKLQEEKKKGFGDYDKKICVLLSLNTTLNITKILDPVNPRYRSFAVVAYLAYTRTYQERVHANKIKLYKYRQDFAKMDLDAELFRNITAAYFKVSYLQYDDKHSIKKQLNEYVRRFQDAGKDAFEQYEGKLKEAVEKKPLNRQKPLALVPFEYMSSGHAMYRFFGRKLKSMRDHFDVVLAGTEKYYDDIIKEEFPNFRVQTPEYFGGDILEMKYSRPDLMFMPSVGMMATNIIISNYRFCDLQIMALGHPATTMAPYIDFVIGPEEWYHPKAFPNDRFICDPTPIMHQKGVQNEEMELGDVSRQEPRSYVNIGVVGTTFKMSYDCIRVFKEIEAEADFEVRFKFLTNATGLEYASTYEMLRDIFPNASVFPYSEYDKYMSRIKSDVDIVLNPFPFGNSNALNDILFAGKPNISLTGIEPHNRVHISILDHVGLTEEFAADNIEEYKAKFFKYARQILTGKRDFFDPQEIYDKVYAEDQADYEFGDVMYWIYKNKEKLLSSKKKLVHPDLEAIRSRKY